MEEVNYLYFENKSVSPPTLLVSGGRLSDASMPRIKRFIEEKLKGKANQPTNSSQAFGGLQYQRGFHGS